MIKEKVLMGSIQKIMGWRLWSAFSTTEGEAKIRRTWTRTTWTLLRRLRQNYFQQSLRFCILRIVGGIASQNILELPPVTLSSVRAGQHILRFYGRVELQAGAKGRDRPVRIGG